VKTVWLALGLAWAAAAETPLPPLPAAEITSLTQEARALQAERELVNLKVAMRLKEIDTQLKAKIDAAFEEAKLSKQTHQLDLERKVFVEKK
jgi:hypothetical protein